MCEFLITQRGGPDVRTADRELRVQVAHPEPDCLAGLGEASRSILRTLLPGVAERATLGNADRLHEVALADRHVLRVGRAGGRKDIGVLRVRPERAVDRGADDWDVLCEQPRFGAEEVRRILGDRENVILLDEFLRRGQCPCGARGGIGHHILDLLPVDAASGIDRIEVRLDPLLTRLESRRGRPSELGEITDLDYVCAAAPAAGGSGWLRRPTPEDPQAASVVHAAARTLVAIVNRLRIRDSSDSSRDSLTTATVDVVGKQRVDMKSLDGD